MVNVILSADFDLDNERDLPAIIDAVSEAISDRIEGIEPSLGLQVDGEHRDPDEPDSSLF